VDNHALGEPNQKVGATPKRWLGTASRSLARRLAARFAISIEMAATLACRQTVARCKAVIPVKSLGRQAVPAHRERDDHATW
jgi:hypothetical protein